MRAAITSCILLVSLGLSPFAAALNFKDGKVVQGKYNVSGKASFADVKIRYNTSKATVTQAGRILGSVEKIVLVNGKRVFKTNVKIRGSVRKVIRRGTSFVAPATVRFSDGSVSKGKFRGLIGQSHRLSRYFSGKFSGVAQSQVVLRFN